MGRDDFSGAEWDEIARRLQVQREAEAARWEEFQARHEAEARARWEALSDEERAEALRPKEPVLVRVVGDGWCLAPILGVR